jgi:hypothetical protein
VLLCCCQAADVDACRRACSMVEFCDHDYRTVCRQFSSGRRMARYSKVENCTCEAIDEGDAGLLHLQVWKP